MGSLISLVNFLLLTMPESVLPFHVQSLLTELENTDPIESEASDEGALGG